MTEPTEQDLDNARLRQEVADRFRAEHASVEALAATVFGPGWAPVGTHALVDHDEADAARREGRRMRPAAVVHTAEKDGLRRHFAVTDGEAREVASYQAGFGAMLTEPHPTRTFTVKGETHHAHRYGLYWSGFDPDYRPLTAEQLAAARDKREARAVEREAASNPLFADLIRGEGYVRPRRKGRSR